MTRACLQVTELGEMEARIPIPLSMAQLRGRQWSKMSVFLATIQCDVLSPMSPLTGAK